MLAIEVRINQNLLQILDKIEIFFKLLLMFVYYNN